MDILVCGMHRSGTSAISHLISIVSEYNLLDDPEWAIWEKQGILSYKINHQHREEIEKHKIVKCPRATEHINTILDEFPNIKILFCIRNPLDVWSSIVHAQFSTSETVNSMLDYQRLASINKPIKQFASAFNIYMDIFNSLFKKDDVNLFPILYEKFYYNRPYFLNKLCKTIKVPIEKDIDKVNMKIQFSPARNKPEKEFKIKGPGRWENNLCFSHAKYLYKQTNKKYNDALSKVIGYYYRIDMKT